MESIHGDDSRKSPCRKLEYSSSTIHSRKHHGTARRRFIPQNTTAQLVDDSSPKTPRHSSSTIHPKNSTAQLVDDSSPKTPRHSSSTIHSQKHHGAARRRFILKNSMVQHVLRDDSHSIHTRFTLDSFDSHSIHSIHSGVELWSRFKSTFKLWKQVSGRFMKTPKVDSRSRFMPK